MKLVPIAALAAMALSGCQTMDEAPGGGIIAQAPLRTADGSPAGMAQLIESGSQVSVTASLSGISPGVHAVHLHTTGSCQAPDFTSAGGHLNPASNEHGFQNPQGYHLGDLPNATVASDGTGTVSATLRGAPQQVLSNIFDADGTAIVVHAGPDDYRTDPAGDAGSRVACGVFMRN